MNNTFISIIMPVYNSRKYILKSLQCIEQQTDRDFELIICDDGSTDGSSEFVYEYLSDKNISFNIIVSENSGVSHARNLGIEKASGKYLFFLDSDDLIERNFIYKCKDKLKNDKFDVLFFGYDKVDEFGKVMWSYEDQYNYLKSISEGIFVFNEYLRENIIIWNSSAIYRSELIRENRIRYLENCHNGEDQNFILKSLYVSSRVFNIEEVLAHYLQRNTSVSHSFSLKRLSVIYAFEDLCDYMKCGLNNEKMIDILKLSVIPLNLMGNINSMVKKSSIKDIMMIVKRNEVRCYFKKYNHYVVSNGKFRYLFAIKGMYWFPRLYFPLYKYILSNLD